MQWLAQDALEFGSEHYQEWMGALDGIRTAAARMINATPAEIAIVKNTSEGIATVAIGIDWKPGDVIVAFEEEFPANLLSLAASRIAGRRNPLAFDLRRSRAHRRGCERRAPACHQLRPISERVSRRISISSAKSAGAAAAFSLSTRFRGWARFRSTCEVSHIDALAADGHKWLLGPEGCGVLYVRRDVQDQIEPVEFGWTNVAQYADYSSRDMSLRQDAGRYECGTLNTIGCFGLRAALDLLLEAGIGNVSAAVQKLGDQIWNGAQELGYETLGRRDRSSGAGIVSIRKPGVESHFIVRKLKDAGFTAAPRQGWVRIAPHFYIAPWEIEALLHKLQTF